MCLYLLSLVSGNMRSHYCIFFKIKFEGISGDIAFDDKGYRKDYGLRLFKFGFRSPLKEVY